MGRAERAEGDSVPRDRKRSRKEEGVYVGGAGLGGALLRGRGG